MSCVHSKAFNLVPNGWDKIESNSLNIQKVVDQPFWADLYIV